MTTETERTALVERHALALMDDGSPSGPDECRYVTLAMVRSTIAAAVADALASAPSAPQPTDCTNCGESAKPPAAYAGFVGPFCEGCWDRLREFFTAPSGWQQRIAAMQPYTVDYEGDEVCRFCGILRLAEVHDNACLWQNAKDAPTQDPIAAAVDAQLDPLKDELIAMGHKLVAVRCLDCGSMVPIGESCQSCGLGEVS